MIIKSIPYFSIIILTPNAGQLLRPHRDQSMGVSPALKISNVQPLVPLFRVIFKHLL